MSTQPVEHQAQLVKINCIDQREFCLRFGVNAFPIIFLMRRLDPLDLSQPVRMYEYSGGRTALSFLVFASQLWSRMPGLSLPTGPWSMPHAGLAAQVRSHTAYGGQAGAHDAHQELPGANLAPQAHDSHEGHAPPQLDPQLAALLGVDLAAQQRVEGAGAIHPSPSSAPAAVPRDDHADSDAYIHVPLVAVWWLCGGLMLCSGLLAGHCITRHWKTVRQMWRKQTTLPSLHKQY